MTKRGNGVEPSSFIYVDARSGNSKWTRMNVKDVPDFAVKHKHHDVYCTVQRYALKSKNKDAEEPMYAPLFFDFDSKRDPLQLIDQGWITVNDIADYLEPPVAERLRARELGQPIDEEVLAVDLGIQPYKVDNPDDKDNRKEHYVELSEDLKMYLWKRNIEIARQDAAAIIDFFMGFGLSEDEVRVWFSGQKGFHVTVNEVVVGTEPHTQLHRIVKHIAIFLQELLDLRSLDSASIYAKGRMWRIPDTVHAKTGRYKTELHHTELKGDVADILELSKTPRGPLYGEDEVEYAVNEKLNAWYLNHVEHWSENERTLTTQASDRVVQALADMEDYPVCVKFVMENGGKLIREAGTNRNAVTFRLASYFKDRGDTLQQAYEAILDWAMKLPRDASGSTAQEKRANTMSAVKAVYENENYHFSCAGFRSVGKRSANDKTVIPCAGRACPVHEDHDKDEEPPIKMHLAETARDEYVGKRVAFDCLVAGKLDTPYQVPRKVEFFCRAMDPDKAQCLSCIMMQNNGSYEREFQESDRFLIKATGQPDNNLKGYLREESHANCNKVSYRTLDYVNVTELLAVPMAERVVSIKVGEDNKAIPLENSVDESGNEYVTRKIYAVGMDVQSNQHYEFQGYVYPSPQKQLATILSQTQIPKEDNVGTFKLTDELREAFKVFQVQSGETLGDRLDLLIQDIVGNVTKVRQRDAVHLAVLMTYHSVLRYYFAPDELEARGWMELCLVGDSGQAKTLLVSRIQEFAGLGDLIGGETVTRTGLIYRMEKEGERWFLTWGKYPLNDRKLLAIDEFSGLSQEDFEQMTESRETGVLRVARAVTTETNARTRLVFMSNPRFGRQLGEFSYGVEALKTLFREAADIRRLDLAVFLKSGDVPQKVLNERYERPATQLILPEIMRASVLWAWSRNENQVHIEKKSMDKILSAATELGDKYGHAVDIPLLEPATLRKKLARMAIALAALVHSTDDTHEIIVVKPEHVQYVMDYLDTLYSYKNCRLDVYASKMRNESFLNPEEADSIMQEFMTGDFLENAHATREVLDIFRKNDILRAQEILDMTGLERSVVNARLNLLQRHSMIKRTRDGMRKLPKFIEFLELYFNEA